MRDTTAVAATGLLAEFIDGRIIGWADFHTAERLALAVGESGNSLAKLALALCMRSLRDGSTCLPLSTAHDVPPEGTEDDEPPPPVTWPDLDDWRAALSSSRLVVVGPDEPGRAPLRLVGDLVYLERYWQAERSVSATLHGRLAAPQPAWHAVPLAPDLNPGQRRAVVAAATHTTSVIVGGPGTGKTHTVAALLAALLRQPVPPSRIALAAPTGKAAARMEESIAGPLAALGLSAPPSSTLHRLLGLTVSRPFAPTYHAGNLLPHDLVIVDETSMLSLLLMQQLLEALRPDARLVLIGDRDQLASVDAGAVLSDLVSSPGLIDTDTALVELTHNYRFGADTAIGRAAEAIRTGDADACLAALAMDPARAALIESDAAGGLADLPGLADALLASAYPMRTAALAGDGAAACAALDIHRLLCAHHGGPWGEVRWNRLVHALLATRFHDFAPPDAWYPGQPILITRNSQALGPGQQVFNGDTGVVIDTPGGLRAAIARGAGPMVVAPQLLDSVTTLHAMTVHKSQGSQFAEVSVILPPVGSPLLTRELLYTALTRAQRRVVIYGSRDAVAEAVRTPARRASGLGLH